MLGGEQTRAIPAVLWWHLHPWRGHMACRTHGRVGQPSRPGTRGGGGVRPWARHICRGGKPRAPHPW
eukprot:8500243-Alexandrium_andersonii.AAC.1